MRYARLLVIASALTPATATAPASAATPKRYKNCAALNKVYPHGVGKAGARDKTSGQRVTTFRVNAAVYKLNTARDRDHDGIACEKL